MRLFPNYSEVFDDTWQYRVCDSKSFEAVLKMKKKKVGSVPPAKGKLAFPVTNLLPRRDRVHVSQQIQDFLSLHPSTRQEFPPNWASSQVLNPAACSRSHPTTYPPVGFQSRRDRTLMPDSTLLLLNMLHAMFQIKLKVLHIHSRNEQPTQGRKTISSLPQK